MATGAKTDVESVRAITDDVREALTALTVLGTAALSVAGVATRATGVQPDVEATN